MIFRLRSIGLLGGAKTEITLANNSLFEKTNRFLFFSRLICVMEGKTLKGKERKGLQTNDQDLIEHIMARYKYEFVRVSFVYLAEPQLANVAVTNTFLILSRRLHQYPGENEEKVWALRYLMRELHRLKFLKGIGLKPLILTQRR